MAVENMKDKAEKLFELTDKGRFPPTMPNAPPKIQEMRNVLSDGYRDLRIKLFAEYYSEEQMDALLDFYESDLGRSILKAQGAIEEQFEKEMSEYVQKLNRGEDGGIGVVVEPKK
ncbi:MAG: DUF2059 domain-containing protein [Pseudohongiellaceae bacterium]